MKLSPEQIQELYSFLEKKRVRYYDLQVELADHLASRIEDLMTADRSLSFESALYKVYHDFGIFGFSKVVQEKEQQMARTGSRLMWKEFRKLFSWPQLMLVSVVAAVTWQLINTLDFYEFYPIVGILWLVTTISFGRVVSVKRKKQKKPLLIMQYDPAYTSWPFFCTEVIFFSMTPATHSWLFFVVVVTGVFFKICSYRVYKNTSKEAAALYPEAFA